MSKASEPEDFFTRFLSRQKERNLYRRLSPIEARRGPYVEREGRWLLNASSNDYLGLSLDPRLAEAARIAMEEYGFGSGASRLITGDLSLHEELEDALARWKGAEAALLFNSGYHANVGVISALVGEGDLIYSDALNHASIIDGCRLSRARVRVFRHNDCAHLESLLKEDQREQGNRLIVVETIFSMDGDEAPLREILELAERYGAWVMVDEAHASGVVGPEGRGLVAELGIPPEAITASVGTLGKALGTFGAFVTGSRSLREFLINRARSFIFTTALPVPVLAASLKALELVRGMEEARTFLLRAGKELRERLCAQGLTIPPGRTPIIPWIIGSEEDTLRAGERLKEEGVLGVPIRPPTVPPGTSRIRLTLNAAFSPQELKLLEDALTRSAQMLRG